MESAVVFKVAKGSEEFREYALITPMSHAINPMIPIGLVTRSPKDPHMYEKASKNPSQGASGVARP